MAAGRAAGVTGGGAGQRHVDLARGGHRSDRHRVGARVLAAPVRLRGGDAVTVDDGGGGPPGRPLPAGGRLADDVDPVRAARRAHRRCPPRTSTTCSGWSRSGSCCPTCRSPTCCCGCRPDGDEFLCVAQVRPTTGPTAYQDDQVGRRRAARPRRCPPRGDRRGPDLPARPTRSGTATGAGPPGGDPGAGSADGQVIARDRPGHQPDRRPHAQPRWSWPTCSAAERPVPDGRRRHVPAGRAARRDAHRPAGRRRAAPARRRRPGRRTPARTRCRPTTGSASPATWSAPTSAALTRAAGPPTRSTARELADRIGGAVAGAAPLRMEVEAQAATIVLFRAIPLRPGGRAAGRAGAGPRRHRGAPPGPRSCSPRTRPSGRSTTG